MKRALALLILVAVVIAGLFSIRGALPFLPILGVSMEPEFKAGDLITIEEVSPSEVEVGDVIVFTVPPLVREAYDYPKVVVHRVVRAYTTERDTTFRTRGDNVDGEDPFMVRSKDVKGQPGRRIPYLGFPLLYLQSQHGLIFVVVSLFLLTLYLYVEELSLGSGKVQKRLLAPVIEENRRSSHLLEQRIETTEKGMVSTEQALTNFASAIQVYAEHLKSHTTAIQGLSEASQELKHSAAEQNKVLNRLAEVMDQIVPGQEEEAREQVENESAPVDGAVQFSSDLTRNWNGDKCLWTVDMSGIDGHWLTGVQVMIADATNPRFLLGWSPGESKLSPIYKGYNGSWGAPTTTLPAGMSVSGSCNEKHYVIQIPKSYLGAGGSTFYWGIMVEATWPGHSSSQQHAFPPSWVRWTAIGTYKDSVPAEDGGQGGTDDLPPDRISSRPTIV